MKKHLHSMLLLVALLCVTLCTYAQQKVVDVDFESGIPSAWSQSPTGGSVLWSTGSSGVGSITPYAGTSYAQLVSSTQTTGIQLITELADISSLDAPLLSYYFAQPSNSLSRFDTLKVYYRTSTSGGWTLIQTENAAQPMWLNRSISLAGLSSNGYIQIAFEYNRGNGLGIALDNVYIGNEAFSVTPYNLSALRITHNSAYLNWAGASETMQYYLKISTTPMSDLTQAADFLNDTVYVTPAIITNLQPNTQYYFYVKGDCGYGDVSAWSSACLFKTLCAPMVLPFTENFESGSISTCWTQTINYSGDWGLFTPDATLQPHLSTSVARGTNSVCLTGSYNNLQEYVTPRITNNYLVTPKISVTDINTTQLTFWTRSASKNSRLSVGLMSDPSDASTFEEVALLSIAQESIWEEMIIPISGITDTTLKYIAFFVDGSERSETAIFYIDDIELALTPDCSKPSIIRTTNLTSNSVSLTWTSSNSSAWDVKISTNTIDPTTVTADFYNGSVSTKPATFTGLASSTTYYVYMRSNCGTSQSEWSNVYSFTTPCAPISSFPYTEGFEDYISGGYPNCWHRPILYNGNPQVYNKNIAASAKSLQMSSAAGSATYAVSPAMETELSAMQVSFSMQLKDYSIATSLEIGVMTDPDDVSTFIPVDTVYALASGAKLFIIPLNNVTLTGHGHYIALRSSASSDGDGVYIDDFTVDSLPECNAPTDVHSTSVTSTSLALTWSQNTVGNRWIVKVLTSEVSNIETAEGEFFNDTVTVNNLSLTGLTMGLTYYVYIKSDCGTETSNWGSFSFSTPCGVIETLPFEEDFTYQGKTYSDFPKCWSHLGISNPYISTYYNNKTTHKNSYSLATSTSTYSPLNLIILPQVDVPGKNVSDMQISFAFRESYGGTGCPIIVGVMTNPLDSTTFVPVDTVTNTVASTYTMFDEISFANYSGTGKYVAFMFKSGVNGRVAISGTIDDVRLELIPTCPRILDVEMSDVNDIDATATWSVRASEQSWQVVIGDANFDPNTATPITVTNTSYTFTGLTPNTTYDIYVRANCGGTDGTSAWSDVNRFSTTPTPENIPIYCDFSDETSNSKWVLVNGSQTNHWVIGTSATTEGKSLYISIGSGEDADYSYDETITSYVYAYRYMKFNPGAYRISFDWKSGGDAYMDLGRVCLVEKDVELEAGNANGMTSTNNVLPTGWVVDLGNGNLYNHTSWTNVSRDLTLEDTCYYKLVVFWKNNNYTKTQTPFALDNLSIEELECVPASNIASVATDTTATISWTYFAKVPRWDVRVSTTALTAETLETATDLVFSDTVNVNQVQLTNLISQTTYYVYVRSNCQDGTFETWTAYEFTTECGGIDRLPYSEDFENITSFPSCWNKTAAYSSYPYVNTYANHTAGGSKTLAFGNSSSTTNLAVMQRMDADSVKNLILSFYTYYYSANQKIDIGVMTNPKDASTFTLIQTVTHSIANDWESHEVALSSYTGDGSYIAFRTGNTNAYNYVMVDDILIKDNRTCQQPNVAFVSRLTTNSVKLNWSSANDNSLYNIKLSSTSINPEVEQGDLLNIQGIQDLYYDVLNGLQPDQLYYFYVQSDCGDVKNSYWSEEVSFRTLCTAISAPYTQDFESFSVGEMPSCWHGTEEVAGAVPASYIPSVASISGTKALQMDGYYSSEREDLVVTTTIGRSIAVLPSFTDSLSNLYVQFRNYSSLTNSFLKIGVMTDVTDASTFTLVDTLKMGDWQESSVSFANYQDSGFIAFMWDGEMNGASGSVYLDNITVDYISGCKPAASLWTEEVTNSTCDIIWKPLTNLDTVWQVQVGTYNAGTDLTSLDNYSDFLIDTVVTGSQVSITGLEPLTTYYYYVRPICEGSYGPRYNTTKSFRTACDNLRLPYTENFDSYASGEMPECWMSLNNVSYDPNPYVCSINAVSGTRSLYVYSTAGTYAIAILPLFDVDSVRNLSVSFKGTSNYSNVTMDLGVMTDPSDPRSFELITQFVSNEMYAWESFSSSLGNYEGQGRYVALRSTGDGANYMLIDDLEVVLEVGCAAPSAINFTNQDMTSVMVNWTKGEVDYAWDLVYGPQGFDPETAIDTTIYTNMYMLSGLVMGNAYDVYVRTNCGGGSTSSWAGPMTYLAPTLGDSIPFVSQFESSNEGWSFVNGSQRNTFVIGNGTSYEGTGALYISNNATTLANSYTTSYNSVVYAYKTVYLEPGSYEASYVWKGLAERNYDYARAFIAPQSVSLVAGTSNFSYTSLPAGAISVDGNTQLSNSSDWALKTASFDITTAGNYKLVFAWRNDGSDGSQPPFAVDSVSIVRAACYDPIISTSLITGVSASFDCYMNGSSMTAKVSTTEIDDANLTTTTGNIFDGALTNGQLNLTGLQPSTSYYVYVNGICSNGNTSSWVSTSFMTECNSVTIDATNSYTQNFDSLTTFDTSVPCWTLGSTDPDMAPYLEETSNTSPNALFLMGMQGDYSYAVSPRLEGLSVNQMQVRFNFAAMGSATDYILVGAMTNPNDINTFVKIDSIYGISAYEFESKVVDMSSYPLDGKYIAFKSADLRTSYTVIDDVVIEKLDNCVAPTVVNAVSMRSHSFDLLWNSKQGDVAWQVKVYSNNVVFDLNETADVRDIIVNEPKYTVSGISAASTYTVAVRKVCDNNEYSAWSEPIEVSTTCGTVYLPYYEPFDGAMPGCWDLYEGLLDSVIVKGGLQSVMHGWTYSSSNALSAGHSTVGMFSNYAHYWMVTPEIVVNSGAKLSFDLALTQSGTSAAITSATGMDDDRFIMLVTTDNGATWDTANMVVWSDLTGDYTYSNLPNTGRTYEFGMSRYMGESIRVAFYAESTNGDGNADIHVDNVRLNVIEPVYVNDQVCQGYAYLNNGFSINASELQNPGTVSFSRITTTSAGMDSIIVVNLTINPSSQTYLNATICEGDVYNMNGFTNLTVAGEHILNLTSSNGCDSLVVLNLTIKSTQGASSELSVCANELPYEWYGMSLTTSNTYNTTLTSSIGCDSIISLVFTVSPSYNVTDVVNIYDTDLPYTYMDTVFTTTTPVGTAVYVINGVTEDGCDSIVNLTLTIDHLSGLIGTETDYFDLYPNPIHKFGEVTVNGSFTTADFEGMTLEVFNSAGQVVLTEQPKEQPIRISGFETSGVYIVRISTSTGRVVYGKVVVQ